MLDFTIPPTHGQLGLDCWLQYEEGVVSWWFFWVDPVDNGATCPGEPMFPSFTFPAWRGHQALVQATLIAHVKARCLS